MDIHFHSFELKIGPRHPSVALHVNSCPLSSKLGAPEGQEKVLGGRHLRVPALLWGPSPGCLGKTPDLSCSADRSTSPLKDIVPGWGDGERLPGFSRFLQASPLHRAHLHSNCMKPVFW